MKKEKQKEWKKINKSLCNAIYIIVMCFMIIANGYMFFILSNIYLNLWSNLSKFLLLTSFLNIIIFTIHYALEFKK